MLAKSSQIYVVLAIALLQAASVLTATEVMLDQPTAVSCQLTDLNVTTSTEDYIIANQRQYDAIIRDYEETVAAWTESQKRQVEVVEKQNVLLLRKLQETNEVLEPLEVLSLVTKHCVQKYKWQLPDYTQLQNSLIACTNVPISYIATDISAMNNVLRLARDYYTKTVINSLTNCNKTYPGHHLNYTMCVTQVITSANTYTVASRANFAKGEVDAVYALGNRINSLLACSFPLTYNSASVSGVVLNQVESCIDELRNASEQCNNGNNTSCGSNTCAYSMDVLMSDVNFNNETIRNPFFGLHENKNCMLVNFVKELK